MPPHVTLKLTLNEARALAAVADEGAATVLQSSVTVAQYLGGPVEQRAAERALDKLCSGIAAKVAS